MIKIEKMKKKSQKEKMIKNNIKIANKKRKKKDK